MKAYESTFTILIVDDDEGHIELVRRNLSRIALGNPHAWPCTMESGRWIISSVAASFADRTGRIPADSAGHQYARQRQWHRGAAPDQGRSSKPARHR